MSFNDREDVVISRQRGRARREYDTQAFAKTHEGQARRDQRRQRRREKSII
ncbi:hypothetical protein [Methylobacterium ajmalii]|uniref:hypothetical protein n=1 Tax=Methylobacterium ajmalii TaxID=2738439 RepID=UPI002F35CBDE